MRDNEKLIPSIVILGLVISYILVVLILCVTEVIKFNWINIIIPGLLCISATLLILFELTCAKNVQTDKLLLELKDRVGAIEVAGSKIFNTLESQQNILDKLEIAIRQSKSCSELLLRLKSYRGGIKVSGNRVLKQLKCQQRILGKLKLEIQECNDEEALQVFLDLRNCYKDVIISWKEYVKYLDEYYNIQVERIDKYLVNKKNFINPDSDALEELDQDLEECMEELDEAINEFTGYMGDLVVATAKFEDNFLHELETKRGTIGRLYKDYLALNGQLKKYSDDFARIEEKCDECITILLYYVEEEKDELIVDTTLSNNVVTDAVSEVFQNM
ncbi:hypothetical protein K6025_02730 [Ehrlichia sp. JZT12]